VLRARVAAGVVVVLHTFAHHGAAAGARDDHVVLDVKADGEGEDGVGAQLRGALTQPPPRHTLQPLEHLQHGGHNTALSNCRRTSGGTFMRCTLLERPLRNEFLVCESGSTSQAAWYLSRASQKHMVGRSGRVHEADDAMQALVGRQYGRRHETHEAGVDLNKRV
jgi:hypothetical protein